MAIARLGAPINRQQRPTPAIGERRPACVITTLREMGEWLVRNGESVYGTRGGPVSPRSWGVTTQAGKRVYVHVLDWSDARLFVPLRSKVASARLLRDGSAVAIRRQPDGIELTLPPAQANEWVRVVRLDLAQ